MLGALEHIDEILDPRREIAARHDHSLTAKKVNRGDIPLPCEAKPKIFHLM